MVTDLSLLENKVRESDTEGTMDKKNMTPYIQSSLSSYFHLVMDLVLKMEKESKFKIFSQHELVRESVSFDMEWIPFTGPYWHHKTRILAASA